MLGLSGVNWGASSVNWGMAATTSQRGQITVSRSQPLATDQSVTYHTAICPECGKVYVSGGTTHTSTRAAQEQPALDQTSQSVRMPFSAVA